MMINFVLQGNGRLMNETAADAVDGGGGLPDIGDAVESETGDEISAIPSDEGGEVVDGDVEVGAPGESRLHEFAHYLDSPERLAEYRRAMGIPEDAEAYEITLNEGQALDEPDLAFLKKVGVDHGIPMSAMSALARDYVAAHAQVRGEIEAEYEAGFKELAKEWGADYDARIADAKLAAGKVCAMAGVDLNVLRGTEFGSSADAFKLFSYIGGLIKEGRAKGVSQAQTASGEAEARRIESDPSHPLHEAYMDYKHPNHKYANDVYDRCMGLGH